MEMHTVHVADDSKKAESSGFGYAALGIMFSVNEYTTDLSHSQQLVIDRFFDSMNWTAPPAGEEHTATEEGGHRRLSSSDENPLVEKVNYGEMMMMFDMDKRWG